MAKKLISYDDAASAGQRLPAAVRAEVAALAPAATAQPVVYSTATWAPGATTQPLVADKTKLNVFGSSTPHALTPVLQSAITAQGWGITCTSAAQPGERYEHTLARLGIINAQLTFPSNTVPASGSVTVTCSLPNQNLMKTYTGKVAGIAGTLALTGSGGTFTFTRTTAGSATAVSADVEFVPDAVDGSGGRLAAGARDAIAVVDTGKNNIGTTGIFDAVNAANDLVIDWLVGKRKRVVLLGMFANSVANAAHKANVAAINAHRAAVAAANPDVVFVDTQAYVTGSQIWTDTGITPTTDDLAMQADGRKPTSLSLDDAHLSTAALTAVVDRVVMPKLAELLSTTYSYTPQAPPDITTGLKHRWIFDGLGLAEGAEVTTVPAASGASSSAALDNVHATASRRPTMALAEQGGHDALELNRTNQQYIRTALFGTGNEVAQPATIVAVARRKATGTVGFVVSGGVDASVTKHMSLSFESSSNLVVASAADGASLSAGAQDTNWHVLIGVYDAASSAVYIDGVATAGNIPNAANGILPRVTLGANSAATANYGDSYILEVRVYSRALTAEQCGHLTNELKTRYAIA